MDAAQFRLTFPEFNDIARFPTAQINFYFGLAAFQVPLSVFGPDVLPFVSNLFVAHNLALTMSSASGPVSSKSVGSVSVSYDTNATNEQDAGWYNSTIYGKQYYRLMMIYGAGAIQL